MTKSISVPFRLIVAWLAFVGSTGRSFANEASPASVLAPFVNYDTFFASYVDMTSLPAVDAPGDLFHLGLRLPEETQNRFFGIVIVSRLAKRFQDAGGQRLYTLMGLEDFNAVGGPVLLATTASGKDPAGVERMIRDAIREISADSEQVALLPVARLLKVKRVRNVILVGTESVVERYGSRPATTRDDLIEPLVTMSGDGAALAAVFSPGPDFRRVVRELWPKLPPPLEALRGELAARWLRLEFAAKTQGTPSAQLAMQATDATSAELFAQLLQALPNASEQFTEIGNKRHDLKRYLHAIVEAVPPEVDGTRVVMQLPTDESRLAKLKDLVGEATDATLESTRRRQRMNQSMQIALGIFNYESANKHLPPPAIRDRDGQPLLSWRVAILPYAEQNHLYKQFRLDEPWDSPHNLALVKSFPSIYGDPAHPELAREGKTTYVVPIGPGTVFDTKVGLPLREIKDGSSRTIMVVEVPAENAVIWTKPEDWEVDMGHPWRGLERTDRDYVTAAWADGHGSLIPTNTEPEKLRSVLTRAGGETVDWP